MWCIIYTRQRTIIQGGKNPDVNGGFVGDDRGIFNPDLSDDPAGGYLGDHVGTFQCCHEVVADYVAGGGNAG